MQTEYEIQIDEPSQEEESEIVWLCYDCGNTESFSNCRDWESGVIDDVQCNVCNSTNTAEMEGHLGGLVDTIKELRQELKTLKGE